MTNLQILIEARKKADSNAWHFLTGGANDEIAARRNRGAFQNWALVPRVLKDVSRIDTAVRFLGMDLPMPVMAAPVGHLTLFHEDGELAWAQGLSQTGVLGTVSGVARFAIDEIMAQGQAPMFFQLYFHGDDLWVKERVQWAEALGYKAIVITVDTAYNPQRERLAMNGYDYRQHGRRQVHVNPAPQRIPALDWQEVDKIRSYTHLPVVIKGVASEQDVRQCVKYNIDAVWISNHGGRMLDYSGSALDALTRLGPLCKTAGLPVIFDGGVRRGAEVLMAMMLGADLVALGRLAIYGLIYNGAEGVAHVFENVRAELTATMGTMGMTDLHTKPREVTLVGSTGPIFQTLWDAAENQNLSEYAAAR